MLQTLLQLEVGGDGAECNRALWPPQLDGGTIPIIRMYVIRLP
jgi:hypothetical protein